MERMKSNKTRVERKTSWDLKPIQRKNMVSDYLIRLENKEQASSGCEY